MNDKLSSWEDCLEKNFSIKTYEDILRGKSLIETALHRIKYINKDFNKNTANYIFEDYYTSILEMLEAIILFKGYKVFNHVCLGLFLKDILKKEDLFRIFDELRFKRNSLIYYGKRMMFEDAKLSVTKAIIFIRELKNLLKNIP
jgi:uncharacterized protein (UPF0332 family)